MNNQITVIGYVGQNPSVRSFEDTKNAVVKFSVAVKEFSSNTDEEKTMWIDVDAWNGLGERVMSTITKGREVALTGRLVINHYTREVGGQTVPMTKAVINLTSFHLCGKKPVAEAEVVSTRKPRVRKLASAS
ncbi:hypothetical protein BH11CYA1_BH11CYA1_47900 [soil metagenome]